MLVRVLRTFSMAPTFPVDLLVVDQACRIENPGAQQSQYIAALTYRADRIMLLAHLPTCPKGQGKRHPGAEAGPGGATNGSSYDSAIFSSAIFKSSSATSRW